MQWSAWQALAAIGRHSAHIQLPAIVHGNQSDGGCPPLLRVVPQQDVCDCDDDEGLGCVAQPTQQAVDGSKQDVAPEERNSIVGCEGVALHCLHPACQGQGATICWLLRACAALPASIREPQSYCQCCHFQLSLYNSLPLPGAGRNRVAGCWGPASCRLPKAGEHWPPCHSAPPDMLHTSNAQDLLTTKTWCPTLCSP